MNQATRRANVNEWRKPNPPRPKRSFQGGILSSLLSSEFNCRSISGNVGTAETATTSAITGNHSATSIAATSAATANFSTPAAAPEVKYIYNREKEINNPYGPPVLLISTKAGGVGLTLTEANHVFLMEPQWNLASEVLEILSYTSYILHSLSL